MTDDKKNVKKTRGNKKKIFKVDDERLKVQPGKRGKSLLVEVAAEEGVVLKVMHTKCNPKKLRDLFEKLNDKQKNCIVEIGFGGLFQVLLTKIPHGIVPWLVERFNPVSYVQKIQSFEYQITGDDVHDIFMLPRNPGNEVPIKFKYKGKNIVPSDSVSKENDLRAGWVESVKGWAKVTASGEVSLSCVKKRLISLADGGDEFKQLFVIYACGCFLAPTSTGYVDPKLLLSVQDVGLIRTFDWCSYVIDKLAYSIRNFRETDFCSVSGCVVVLLFCYLHRFNYLGRNAPSSLPLCSHWTDKIIEDRIGGEKKVGYGLTPMSSIYPITKAKQSRPLFHIGPQFAEGFVKYPIGEGLLRNSEIKACAENVSNVLSEIIVFLY